MIDPYSWSRVASELLRDENPVVADTVLRRVVSTAYYSVFHVTSMEAADCFAGYERRGSAAHTLIYRSLDHRRFREMCNILARQLLPAREASLLSRTSVSAEARFYANAVVLLQEARHAADYDPARQFAREEAQELLNVANLAIFYLNHIREQERTDILALILFRARQ